ncbi:HD-GYP domain-containing protein [Abyssisolibacter fermentans]|uniref:HD-GYP domain-containing protein n=1 Tax=Abyssisolibacter fermentans TaxID=1766203 RepID=UPI00082A9619|nr:HD-GYP domain-containing protein [Abyssisolibacter fermentans]
MKHIGMGDARQGMVLSKDSINEVTGITVLTKGTVLNQNLILHMKNMGIDNIYIIDETYSDEEKIKKRGEKAKTFVENHSKLNGKAKKVFEDVKIGKKILVSEINNEADEIISELYSSDNILAKLRQIKDDNDYTFKHSINVSILSTMVGKWLSFSKVEMKQLFMAGLFHDIGKLKISADIINKPDKLDKRETEIIKKHPVYGYELLSNTVGISKNVMYGVLQHHEREDGSGYPFGLKSDKIHEFAKIIAVCDVFDAMTSSRVYRNKISPFKVAEQISHDSFGVLNPKISLLFLKNISAFYVGNIVKLNNGEIGEIVYVDKNNPTRPVVKVDDIFCDLMKAKDIEIMDVID